MYNPEARSRRRTKLRMGRMQGGVTLIELMVSTTIGILVIGAAMASMLLSRTASTTISDISQLQQQGARALRIMGTQIRQVGSVELVPSPGLTAVAFSSAFNGFNGGGAAVAGIDGAEGAPDTVSVSNQPATTPRVEAQNRDCLGNNAPPGLAGIRLDSTFFLARNGELKCQGAGSSGAQAIAANVADLQAWYRVKIAGTNIQRLTAAEVTQADLWAAVRSVEICLDLQGNETGYPGASVYTNCNGMAAQNNGRLHLLLRNVFDLRTQGS